MRPLAAIGGTVVGAGALYALGGRRVKDPELLEEPDAIYWRPPSRDKVLNRLRDEQFDVLIIGGGATGAGCAVDAASRGLRTACIEAGDWASGTSSKSTKLVHGGVRYLEKAVRELDLAQYRLVREALEERRTVLRIAPHLTSSLPILLPLYSKVLAPYYWVGTKTYDLVAGQYGLEKSYALGRTGALREFPLLKKDGLLGALVYFDGQQDDARMNVALALTALRHGAAAANYVALTAFVKDSAGRIAEAEVEDRLTGARFRIKAAGVINATGPYADNVRRMDDPDSKPMIRASSGVHIVLPSYYSPRAMGLIDPSTSDQRVLFFLPWQSNTLAGTTDAPAPCAPSIAVEPRARPQDVDYLLGEIRGYVDPSVSVRRSDVLSAWAGNRALVVDPTKADTQSLVRSHIILVHPQSGLMTVTGGKWTTYRLMAEETIDRAIELYGLRPVVKGSLTSRLPLIGAHGYRDTLHFELIQQFGFETDVAKHLASAYGDRAFGVALLDDLSDSADEHAGDRKRHSRRWPVSGRRLVPWYPYLEAEVRWAARNEYAVSVTDVLCRRTRLAFHSCRAAADALPRIAEIMAEELGWDAAERARQESEAKAYLENGMGLDSLAEARTESTCGQLREYKKLFAREGQNGYLPRERAFELTGIAPRTDKRYLSISEFLAILHDQQ